MALIIESGIKYEDLEYAYMSGASGAYVDAEDARRLGAVPGYAKRLFSLGTPHLPCSGTCAGKSSWMM